MIYLCMEEQKTTLHDKIMTSFKTQEVASNIYTKNKKVYIYFCNKILFPPGINSKFKNQAIEYQPTNFLQAKLLPCCFTVISSVTLLLFSVNRQISFYIENKKFNNNKYVIVGLCELLGKTILLSREVTTVNCPLTTDYYGSSKFTRNCLFLNYNLNQ